jgi:hypothetical protein
MAQEFGEEPSRECYRRAADARRIADVATDPSTKADFLEIEKRWLSLARSYERTGMLKPDRRERGGARKWPDPIVTRKAPTSNS